MAFEWTWALTPRVEQQSQWNVDGQFIADPSPTHETCGVDGGRPLIFCGNIVKLDWDAGMVCMEL